MDLWSCSASEWGLGRLRSSQLRPVMVSGAGQGQGVGVTPREWWGSQMTFGHGKSKSLNPVKGGRIGLGWPCGHGGGLRLQVIVMATSLGRDFDLELHARGRFHYSPGKLHFIVWWGGASRGLYRVKLGQEVSWLGFLQVRLPFFSRSELWPWVRFRKTYTPGDGSTTRQASQFYLLVLKNKR